MKVVAVVVQIVLGLIFLIFGLNGFLNFLHAPLPAGLAGAFLGILVHSHYVYFISGVQALAGVLLLINLFAPLALALLGPVIANILTYHATMSRAGLPLAIVVAVLWLFLFFRFRAYFASLFTARTGYGAGGNQAI